jgi:hypothetical protein
MRTEQLIVELAGGVVPVRRIASIQVRFAGWCAAAGAAAAVAVRWLGARPDLAAALARPPFVLAALLPGLTAMMAAFAALVLAVPGAERTRAVRASALTMLAIWGTLHAAAWGFAEGTLASTAGWTVCFVRVVAVGAVPSILLIALVRRAAPLRRRYAGSLAALGGMAAGGAAIRMICPSDAAGHALLGHAGPALVLCAVAALAAPLLVTRR